MSSIAELEEQFHIALVDLHNRATNQFGYVGARHLQMVTDRGGVQGPEEWA